MPHMCVCVCVLRYITIAGAVVHFYWTQGERDKMPRFPLMLALKNTVRYALPADGQKRRAAGSNCIAGSLCLGWFL